ncbi:MAG: DNA repair protein RecN, partial [Candidatus Omnitrophota bacterium]
LTRIQSDTEELLSELNSYTESLSFEPEEAQRVNAQYNIYYDILRKYGPTIKDAEVFFINAKERFELLNNLEQNSADLDKKIELSKNNLKKTASKITAIRKKQAMFLKDTIEKELSELGIKNVQFECRVEKNELTINGADSVTFYISPNLGEELKPLAEIVSSGEAARVMLALKKALTEVDPIPVLIFDEIDAQIGGRLGTIIGKKLKSIAENRQVILITHLPQIASFADRHFKVFKTVENNRTTTTVSKLEGETRVKELAEMMSGDEKTDISLEHARKILNQAISS